MGDDAPHNAGDGSWLTYDQIAASRHITRRAAVRMTQRHHLRRQPGNDGLVRVWVPHDMAEPSPRVTLHDDAGDDRGDDARDKGASAAALAAIEAAHGREIATLRERAEAAEAARDAAVADRGAAIALADHTVGLLKDAVARADRAEAGREGERARADALRDRLEVLQAHAEERAGRAENDVFELKGQLATAQSAAAEAGREAEAARQAAHAFLDDDAARRRLGRLARLRAAWRGA